MKNIEIYRKRGRWVVELNGGVIAKGLTLRGVERRCRIADLIMGWPQGRGTLG